MVQVHHTPMWGGIQLAQLVCNYPNNEMEDEVTIEEADQYFWLHQSVFSEDMAQRIEREHCKTGNQTDNQLNVSGEVDKERKPTANM